ncbi:MAG: TRAP transporter large permease, partial [Elusimicrobiota bacterium]|nr:TRAP transporter large permease [Elusimicrobiota bacterium]
MSSMLLATIILFASFILLLVLGTPIAIAIGASSFLTALTLASFDTILFPVTQKMFSGLDAFAFLAIPFFILSGNIMNKGGIAVRLVDLAQLIVGRLPGSLAATNVVANMFFGAISGSSIAASAAIGGIMTPLEEKAGYNKGFSATVNACSAPTGILIPPSGPLILFSLVSGGTSIAALFVAGYIPGILMGLAVIIVAVYYAKKLKYPTQKGIAFNEKIRIILRALPSLSLVIVVIGGIIAGVFTATEGAAIAVVYSFVLAAIYRQMKLKDVPFVLGEALKNSAMVLFLIATSGIMAWV